MSVYALRVRKRHVYVIFRVHFLRRYLWYSYARGADAA